MGVSETDGLIHVDRTDLDTQNVAARMRDARIGFQLGHATLSQMDSAAPSLSVRSKSWKVREYVYWLPPGFRSRDRFWLVRRGESATVPSRAFAG